VTQRDRDYEALRATLHELRVADERDAPPFAAILARRSARLLARPNARRLAIAAGLVLAAGLAYGLFATRGRRLTVPSEVVALSTWRPATDVLLETPVRRLLAQAPRLGASLLDPGITGDFR
jgi:hypothetical protein